MLYCYDDDNNDDDDHHHDDNTNWRPSDFRIIDLAHKENVVCGVFGDEKHEGTIELQHRDVLERHQSDANACGGCSGGSGLVNIKGGLMHNLK